mmetsp:Transcript_58101/g.131652  ORF Transcript_58101/g.131652 Transcript_58101/m.131652 type:complete len:207 (-) Transcript_58101:898-1518(-)
MDRRRRRCHRGGRGGVAGGPAGAGLQAACPLAAAYDRVALLIAPLVAPLVGSLIVGVVTLAVRLVQIVFVRARGVDPPRREVVRVVPRVRDRHALGPAPGEVALLALGPGDPGRRRLRVGGGGAAARGGGGVRVVGPEERRLGVAGAERVEQLLCRVLRLEREVVRLGHLDELGAEDHGLAVGREAGPHLDEAELGGPAAGVHVRE